MTTESSKRFQEAMAKFNHGSPRKSPTRQTVHIDRASFVHKRKVLLTMDDSFTGNTDSLSGSSSHTYQDLSVSSSSSVHRVDPGSSSHSNSHAEWSEREDATTEGDDDHDDDPRIESKRSWSIEDRFTPSGRPNNYVGGYTPEYILYYRQQKHLQRRNVDVTK